MADRDLTTIISMSPVRWSLDELEQVKRAFIAVRPAVSHDLVRALWLYWKHYKPGEYLFDDMEQNVALALHAQVYGEYRPEADEDPLQSELLREHAADFGPIMPSKLPWGARTTLNGKVLVSLDSMVMHVFVYLEGKTPKQIVIIGEGLPEIRKIVVGITFTASLRVWGMAHDLMNVGALRVELPGSPVTPLDLPMNVVGDVKHPLLQEDVKTAEAALLDLVDVLRTLARNTGLIEIHEANIADHKKLSDDLKKLARSVASGPPLLWAPGSIESTPAAPRPNLATFIPYWRIRRSGGLLGLNLCPDIFKTSVYESLFEAYHLQSIQRILADVRTRKEYYDRHIKEMEVDSAEYTRSSQAQRDAIWGKETTLTQKFDAVLGIWIQLSSPEVISIEKYYENNVPHLIKLMREWRDRMEDIDRGIVRSITRSDAPERRFAASRFLDAAIRQRELDEGQAAMDAFKRWTSRIQPMLWLEWRSHLRRLGIDPTSVFTRHTFFHTVQILDEGATETQARPWIVREEELGAEVVQLLMSPYTVVDRDRSAVVFDTKKGVMVVRDATDFAEPDNGSAASAPTWQSLEELAYQKATSAEQFRAAFREALRANPAEVISKVLTLLTRAPVSEPEEEVPEGAVAPPPPLSEQEAHLRQSLTEAVKATAVSGGLDGAFAARRFRAFHTARERLESAKDPRWQARVWLARAIVECSAEDLNFSDELPALADGRHTSSLTARITAHLERARGADPEFVNTWLDNLGDWGPGKSIGAILSGLPRAGTTCQPNQIGALLARKAVEAAAVARALQQADAELSDDHEFLITAYAKLGRAIERGLLSEYAGAAEGELSGLLEVLTGKVPLSIEGA